MVSNNSIKQLDRRFLNALQSLKKCNSEDEVIALENYLANIYEHRESLGKTYVKSLKKSVFRTHKNYKRFIKKMNIYDRKVLDNYVLNKDFHRDYLGKVTCYIEDYLQEFNDFSDLDYTVLSEDDFYTIFYDFMKSIKQEKLFDKLILEGRIHNTIMKKHDNCFGTTLYNPINQDIDIFIGNFQYDLHSMFTLAHEVGHAYDLDRFNGDIKDYNDFFYQSFYGEVISKLYERLFIDYLINNNILLDEARDKMFEMEIINHDYLLSSYLLTLLDDIYFTKKNYRNISKKEFIDKVCIYFGKSEYIKDFIKDSAYFDLSEEYNYAYGDIISMFLKDFVKSEGLENGALDEFFRIQSELFDKECLLDCGMSSNNYLKLYKREIQLMKK